MEFGDRSISFSPGIRFSHVVTSSNYFQSSEVGVNQLDLKKKAKNLIFDQIFYNH